MEEGAVGVIRLLQILDLPLGLIGIVVGLITAVRLIPAAAAAAVPDLGTLERVAVGLCAAVAMLGFIGTVETLLLRKPDFPPLAIAFAASVILCSLPALLWRSRWRGVAEGAATVFIAVAAILSGFSIGFMFVPLVALMIWVCFLRLIRGFRAAREGATPRVDSDI